MFPNPTLCPADIIESLTAYVNDGRPVGDFLTAVLTNDLCEAISRADESNLDCLPHIVAYVYWHIPARAWGSKEAVMRWYRERNPFFAKSNSKLEPDQQAK